MVVDEVLDLVGGSDVVFVVVFGELEGGVEFGVQFVGVVVYDWQVVVFGWVVGGEGGDDYVVVVVDCFYYLVYVGVVGFGSGKEVEYGVVVLDIVGGFWQVDVGNVVGDLVYFFVVCVEVVVGDMQGGVGKVEYCQVVEVFGEQVVDQG